MLFLFPFPIICSQQSHLGLSLGLDTSQCVAFGKSFSFLDSYLSLKMEGMLFLARVVVKPHSQGLTGHTVGVQGK